MALATLFDGQNLLKMEYSKHSSNGTLKAEQIATYEKGMKDLVGFELDIYIHEASTEEEAQLRFNEVLVLYPEDYDMHIAYANLLEKTDPEMAIEEYKTAISINESREIAYFNLGAL